MKYTFFFSYLLFPFPSFRISFHIFYSYLKLVPFNKLDVDTWASFAEFLLNKLIHWEFKL